MTGSGGVIMTAMGPFPRGPHADEFCQLGTTYKSAGKRVFNNKSSTSGWPVGMTVRKPAVSVVIGVQRHSLHVGGSTPYLQALAM